ncbi:gliding motility-associated C-terminal domain-containing protein [Hymenobacter psoromatis]|uniref:T9SS type B sorting domain-containing protein n=1 Tax=Hymenobacter psoromatis TaxID=1484116 RepID=UPI001CBC6590|nr:gliding motility-associated C-terminal domain-containing protein [Hymenobacter psoromatis]
MRFFLSFAKNSRRATWLLALLLVGLGWLRPEVAQATHIRAGDIQSKVDSITGNPNHILFRLTIYRDKNGIDQTLADTNIFFGDGTTLNGGDKDASGQPLMTRRTDVARSTVDTDVYLFEFDHFFSGAGLYHVSFIGENRNANIVNMANSVNTSFYVQSDVTINSAYGLNHSPVLLAPALDKAATEQVFLHNPAAYDADGDSLSFKLRTCQQVLGGAPAAKSNKNVAVPVDCSNYTYPDNQALAPGAKQVPYTGVPAGDPTKNAILVQDVHTGQITWNAPARAGIYNIAFTVEEWRRTANGFRQIGSVIRDMQIIVSPTDNLPPMLTAPPDVCVVANQPVTLRISATDGSAPGAAAPTPITLFAYSGVLPPTASNPAAFVKNTTSTTSTGTFTWTPDCSRVSNQPYLVVFKAQDSPPNPNVTTPILIDEKTVRITVVGPPPQNVRAVAASSSAGLVSLVTWDRYSCQNAKNLLIFRREGCYNYTPGPCDTGLPAGSGYVQVGSVPPTATTFTDDNAGKGLTRGKAYSYRVYAMFPLPSGGASIVSNEACLTFSGRSAVLTNVDVNTTDATTGQITVKWTQPRADNAGTFGAPYGYRLSRSIGAGAPALVATLTNLTDTTYVDRGLNTTASQYTYTLAFFNTDRSTGTAVEKSETSPTATSVRASLVPDGIAKTITVNWAYTVPWDNSQQPSRIYRQDTPTGTFNQIATVTPSATSGTYVDRAVVAGQQYCYYVQTTGQYAGVPYLLNLLNNSQQVCTTLQEVPCTPVLSVQPLNCDSLANLPSYPAPGQLYQNNLRWTVGNTPAGCATNAVYYRLFRGTTQAGPFVLIDSTTQLTYSDRNLPQPTSCYQVQAVAASGQRSGLSNIACQNDCVFFLLPNIFTPNGDGVNEVFRPKTSSPITTTHIQIFNRWGVKVYESSADPYINWTGGGVAGESTSSGLVSNGVYYYLAEVQFADAAKTKRTYKGWVEVVR